MSKVSAPSMMLRVIHSTTYSYGETVSICHTEARLAPRSERGQTLFDHQLVIEPEPGSSVAHKDYFGNAVTTFTIDEPHEVLRVTAQSLVETRDTEAIHPKLTPPWEQVREAVRHHENEQTFDAYQFVFESPRVMPATEFANYAKPSFAAQRPLLEGALDLCHRIFGDFKYNREATTVRTPVAEAFHSREGVCQDFSHVMIACLRSLGLPARYVSGYLRTGDNGIGAHASHAWLSIFCPGFGWLDLDPTNDLIPGISHVTLGWGRDYSDVPPLQGVALGGADQVIEVEVSVTPEEPAADLA
jgi:transglutaminase-like putative cysteine protease